MCLHTAKSLCVFDQCWEIVSWRPEHFYAVQLLFEIGLNRDEYTYRSSR